MVDWSEAAVSTWSPSQRAAQIELETREGKLILEATPIDRWYRFIPQFIFQITFEEWMKGFIWKLSLIAVSFSWLVHEGICSHGVQFDVLPVFVECKSQGVIFQRQNNAPHSLVCDCFFLFFLWFYFFILTWCFPFCTLLGFPLSQAS